MYENEKNELYSTLNFAKRCNKNKFFLYRLSYDVYTVEVSKHTRKHITEDSKGNLTHTFLKEHNFKKTCYQSFFKEYVVGVDNDVRGKLKDACYLKKLNDNEYEVCVIRAEKNVVDLTGLSYDDIVYLFMVGAETKLIIPLNTTIYDQSSIDLLEKLELL